jgi:hypothetical protein
MPSGWGCWRIHFQAGEVLERSRLGCRRVWLLNLGICRGGLQLARRYPDLRSTLRMGCCGAC